jgi:hypothetical protein
MIDSRHNQIIRALDSITDDIIISKDQLLASVEKMVPDVTYEELLGAVIAELAKRPWWYQLWTRVYVFWWRVV